MSRPVPSLRKSLLPLAMLSLAACGGPSLDPIDTETDPDARLTIERALFYGLDAFRVQEVTPQWEEVAE